MQAIYRERLPSMLPSAPQCQASDQNFESIAAALRASGAVLVHGLIASQLAERLAAALDRAARREEVEFGREFLESIGQVGYVSDFLRIGPEVVELLECEQMQVLLHAIFGELPRLYVAQGIRLAPGEGRGIWPRCWHADMHGMARHFDSGFVFAVNCLLFLDDVDRANGATVAMEGSQRFENLILEDAFLDERALVAQARKGSALLIEGGTWHAAGLNSSTSPRRAIKLMFVRRWIRPEIDYAACVPDCDLPTYVRRLLDVSL